MGINTQLEVNAIPSVENGNLKFALINAKIGKFNINNKILSKSLEKNMNKIPFTINNNIIIIEKQRISPMTLENNSIIIGLQIEVNNLINFKINNL